MVESAGEDVAVTDAGEAADSRLVRIMGREGVERLRAAKVVVLGLGGVGSSCAEALARGGVGHLVLVDHDVVQPSNLNRQALAFMSTIGKKKAQVMAAMVRDINPQANAVPVEEFLLAENVGAFMEAWAADADYVVDAIDTISAKLALAEYACAHGTPLISSMGAAKTGRALLTFPVTQTRYSFSTSWLGWRSWWVRAPSSVKSSSPSESMSSRPTGHTRTPQSSTRLAAVLRPFSSDRVVT